MLLLGLLLALAAAAQEQAVAPDTVPGRNVITKQDLIRLSKEEIGDGLIVELVKAADELPNLTAEDLIELRKAGVSANVLTAVVQRRNTTTSVRPEISGQRKRRRIQVTAALEPQRRALWNRFQEKDQVEEIQVSWGLQAIAWDDRARLDLAGSPACPQESFCRKRNAESGACEEQVAAGSDAWKEQFGCYADARLTKFGDGGPVFEVDLPEAASDVRIVALFREGDNLTPWFTRGADGNSGKRTPGQVRLQLFGSNDFDLELQVKLLMSPGGFVQDLQIGQCHVVNRDEASMERRILSQDRLYCHVEEARF